MVDSQHESLLRAVRHCQESLDYYTEHRNDAKLLNYLDRLCKLPIKVVHLEQTGVGRTVNGLRKLGGEVGDSAKTLVLKWKDMVVGEQEQAEEEDEDDDDDDDEEDGYQSGEDGSNDTDDKDSRDSKPKNDTSSQRKSDNRTEDDKVRKSKHSKGDESGSSRKHHKENGHSKHKSHKRRNEDSSSEDESPKKRHKTDHKRKIDSESEDESIKKDKKHKHKSSKRPRDSSSDFEESRKSDKHRKKEEVKKPEKKSKDRDKEREKDKKRESEKKPKTSKSKNGALITNGIDSGSGASFAEALGMCGPSSSGAKTPKKKPEKERERDKKEKEKEKEKPAKIEEPIPKALKEVVVLDAVDINISSLLPTITPNYRPLGVLPVDLQPKKAYNEFEALSNAITSKNQRTKVYSGNKMGGGKVPSLFELCSRVLQDHIDALEYTGGVPYQILKPILEKSNPNQLYMMEHHNPYLVEDTDELWKLHCQKEFRNKRREELETWREMYLRCLDERDAKLKALTANIKQSQDKSLPVRMTKLAYVETVAKPPRNIARKQAKNGTATVDRKPTAKLVSLATSGEAGKISVPNPGNRAAERTSHAVKPKKAPLMLKSISSFKNRFKR